VRKCLCCGARGWNFGVEGRSDLERHFRRNQVAAHPARSLCRVSLSESRPAGCGLCSSVDHRKSIIIGRWPNEMREYLSAPCGVCSALGAIACLVLFGDLSPGQAPSCYVDGSLAPPRTLSYLDRIPNLTRPRLSASPHHDINIIVNTTRCPTGILWDGG
jgi:hypothetical protein